MNTAEAEDAQYKLHYSQWLLKNCVYRPLFNATNAYFSTNQTCNETVIPIAAACDITIGQQRIAKPAQA
ncbi:hypothetical protein LVJ82_17465 [Vitreoscilla massiliensis]|uniref:Uncharacterized protein n=1 Tax=Vitreoscilla massiliensis TaxID=1689272 RepID=A0ABY4E1T9_9NEIS|nr:hypothetical protein [Vitreoscilla massiliensis]UOO89209.1 hypothetical protein LVJ82_17465 [Vitreoscilla massiliensis]